LIRQIVIPAKVGFFFNTMFNAIDTWYGGRISTQALAALLLSPPVFFLIAMGRSYLKISAFILYAYVVLSVDVAALQGICKPTYGHLVGDLRDQLVGGGGRLALRPAAVEKSRHRDLNEFTFSQSCGGPPDRAH